MSLRENAERKAAGLPPMERRSLAFSIDSRANAIARAARCLQEGHRYPELSRRDLETLDKIDCDLARLEQWLQRVAE